MDKIKVFVPAILLQDLPEHGVTVVFVELPNSKIELLYPVRSAPPSTIMVIGSAARSSVVRPHSQ